MAVRDTALLIVAIALMIVSIVSIIDGFGIEKLWNKIRTLETQVDSVSIEVEHLVEALSDTTLEVRDGYRR